MVDREGINKFTGMTREEFNQYLRVEKLLDKRIAQIIVDINNDFPIKAVVLNKHNNPEYTHCPMREEMEGAYCYHSPTNGYHILEFDIKGNPTQAIMFNFRTL